MCNCSKKRQSLTSANVSNMMLSKGTAPQSITQTNTPVNVKIKPATETPAIPVFKKYY
jgi:hypothetical protein